MAVVFIVALTIIVIVVLVLRTRRGDSTRTKKRYNIIGIYLCTRNIRKLMSFLFIFSRKDTTMQLSQISKLA